MDLQRFVQVALMMVLTATMGYCMVLYTHAEELPDFADDYTSQEETYVPADPSTVIVSDPDVVSHLDAIQDSLTRIADAVSPSDDTDELPAEPEPTAEPVDYSAQLGQISAQLSELQQSVRAATSETAQPAAFEKPFSEYSTSEALVLVLVFAVVLLAFICIIKNFIL